MTDHRLKLINWRASTRMKRKKLTSISVLDEQAKQFTVTVNTPSNVSALSVDSSSTDADDDLSVFQWKMCWMLIIPTYLHLKHMHIYLPHQYNLNVKHKLQLVLNVLLDMVHQKKPRVSPGYIYFLFRLKIMVFYRPHMFLPHYLQLLHKPHLLLHHHLICLKYLINYPKTITNPPVGIG